MEQESTNGLSSTWSGHTTALHLGTVNSDDELLRSYFEEGLKSTRTAKRAWLTLFKAWRAGASVVELHDLACCLYAELRKAQIAIEKVGQIATKPKPD